MSEPIPAKFYTAIFDDDDLFVIYGYLATSEVAFRSNMSLYYQALDMKVYTDFDIMLAETKTNLYQVLPESIVDDIMDNMYNNEVGDLVVSPTQIAINYSLYRPKRKPKAT